MAFPPLFMALQPYFFYTAFLITFTCILSSVIHYLIYSKRIAQWKKSNIPFLQPTLLIGHKYFLNLKYSYLVQLDRIYKENPDKEAVGLFMGTVPLILLRDPKLIRQVFAKNSDKTLTGWIGAKNDEIAQNMVRTSGDKSSWKFGRDTLAPFLTTSRMGGAQFDKIGKQVDKLWAHAEESLMKGMTVDATEMSLNFVMDGMSLSFFGQDTDGYKEKGELHQLVEGFFEPSVHRMLSFYAQMQFPGAANMFESLKLVGQKQTSAMAKILRHSIQGKNSLKSDKNDFVDFLMSRGNGEESKNGKMDSGMNMKQMIGLSLDVVLWGGVDSVATLASFAIHLLSLHPEYQDRIRAEVFDVMRKHKTSDLTFEVAQDLLFTHQCLLETARLYPSLPAIVRLCADDFQVPGTKFTFKKGDKVIIDPYSVHRDPKHFKNPDTFDPERFSPDRRGSIAPESFLSFGNGPRRCPGYKIGILMSATLIAALQLKYNIKPHSHLEQMDATDFHPRCFANVQRENVLIDLVPREIMTQ